MKRVQPYVIGLALLAMAGCTPATDTETPTDTDQTESQAIDTEETENVLYRGLLEEAGVSIFMQGTHKLTLNDGRFIMLESTDVNLIHYEGQNVEVFGSVRATVEQGGMIMRVESVKSLDSSSSSSSEDTSASSESSSSTSDDTDDDSSSSSSSRSSSSSSAATATSSTATTPSSAEAWEASADLMAKAELMAKDKQGPENWTQKYCSTHIGFCIPVHRNWWFKSFGTTSSAVWHLEIGPSEMNNLGEGPITVRLVAGDVSTSGMSDGEVSIEGGAIRGVRSWTGNRHFEIRGPATLETAVRYLTEQISVSGS